MIMFICGLGVLRLDLADKILTDTLQIMELISYGYYYFFNHIGLSQWHPNFARWRVGLSGQEKSKEP